MWTNRFPIWLWRADFPRLRAHIAERFLGAAPPESSATPAGLQADSDARFDAAFARIAGATPRLGAYNLRPGYVQINVMMNWAFAMRPSQYLFHAPDIPQALVKSASAEQLAALTLEPLLALGKNGDSIPNLAEGLCCRIHRHLCRKSSEAWRVNIVPHLLALGLLGDPDTPAQRRDVQLTWAPCATCVRDYVRQARRALARQPPAITAVQRRFCARLTRAPWPLLECPALSRMANWTDTLQSSSLQKAFDVRARARKSAQLQVMKGQPP
eukprot:TRINITY_DN10778_c0_g1_i1.p1 TRINITY_DN10778_c0_g1~~TRINITY_DN10778_c0_g1_i1.p1  ORF type:complete len:313 (+),score=53.20 TRINITY_DN10778_c0_g1_i1:132-941(+)